METITRPSRQSYETTLWERFVTLGIQYCARTNQFDFDLSLDGYYFVLIEGFELLVQTV